MKIQDLRNPMRRQGETLPFGWRMGYANVTYAGKGSLEKVLGTEKRIFRRRAFYIAYYVDFRHFYCMLVNHSGLTVVICERENCISQCRGWLR